MRATEIQLSDRSIVIVPNSQLISQNLRNVTLGGSAQGVASLELMFPLDIDPEEVKELLLNTYRENENILDQPAPFVRVCHLSPDGMTLPVTGYVGSPRIVGVTKSDLLFECSSGWARGMRWRSRRRVLDQIRFSLADAPLSLASQPHRLPGV